MIVSGSRNATLQQIRMVDIHGTRYYDLAYTHEDAPAQVRTARVGVEDVYADPQPGDAVAVTYLMNVAVRVSRRGE